MQAPSIDHESDNTSSEEMPSLTERSGVDDSVSSASSSSVPPLEEIQPPVRSSNVRRNAVPSSIDLTSTNREVTFNPLLPFVLNRGHIQDEHAALLFNPLTQFVIQSMASMAGRPTNGVGADDSRADPQRIEQLLASLFLEERASLVLDPQLHPPVDVRRQDQLVCPTCMVVHLPVEGSIAIPTTTQGSEEQNGEVDDRPETQDNESYSAFFRATNDDEDSDSMPPLEDINVNNGEEVEHNERTNEVRLETLSINEVSVNEEDEGIDDEDSRSTDQSLLNRGFEISRDDDLFIDTSSLSNSTSSGNIVQSNNNNDSLVQANDREEVRSPFLRFLIERTAHQVNTTTEDTNTRVPNNPITHLREYGAIRCFATATCPVCLDEFNPIVALQCGHCVCDSCFEQLGGYLASDVDN